MRGDRHGRARYDLVAQARARMQLASNRSRIDPRRRDDVLDAADARVDAASARVADLGGDPKGILEKAGLG